MNQKSFHTRKRSVKDSSPSVGQTITSNGQSSPERQKKNKKLSEGRMIEPSSGARDANSLSGGLRSMGLIESPSHDGLAQGKVLNIENGPKTGLMDLQNNQTQEKSILSQIVRQETQHQAFNSNVDSKKDKKRQKRKERESSSDWVTDQWATDDDHGNLGLLQNKQNQNAKSKMKNLNQKSSNYGSVNGRQVEISNDENENQENNEIESSSPDLGKNKAGKVSIMNKLGTDQTNQGQLKLITDKQKESKESIKSADSFGTSSSEDDEFKDNNGKNTKGQPQDKSKDKNKKVKKYSKNEAYVDYDIMKGIQVQHEHASKQIFEEKEEVQVQQSTLATCVKKIKESLYGQERDEIAPEDADMQMNSQSMAYFRMEKFKSMTQYSARIRKFEDEQNELINLRKKWILKQSDPYREKWDYVVMLCAVYNCIYLPYEQAFLSGTASCSKDYEFIDYMNYFIDILFFIDIILNFRTTYQNSQTGEEVSTISDIRNKYLKGMFIIDVLATVPIYELFCLLMDDIGNHIQLFAMLKLVRVLRLQRVITFMNTTDDVKLTLQLVKTSFYLILFIHVAACFWFSIVQGDEKWKPGQTKLFGESGKNLYQDFEPSSQLLIILYTSVLALCGNDIYPQTQLQYLVSSCILILGALFNAYMFGTIAVILQTFNRKSQRFVEQVDIANTSMKNMHLPEDIQCQVREFLTRTQSNLDNQRELEEFLKIISPSLKLQVTQQIFENAIRRSPIFAHKNEVIEFMVSHIYLMLSLPEENIISQGTQQEVNHVYFIAQGTCDVIVLNHMKQKDPKPQPLQQGNFFGEVSLLFPCLRTATVKSQNYCTLAYLRKDNFIELWAYSPDTFHEIEEHALRYDDKWIQFKIKLLKQIDYFDSDRNNHEFFVKIQYHMQEMIYQKGNQILGFEEDCQNIYFIVNGKVDLEIMDQEGNIHILETLQQGDNIGQYSVLYHSDLVFRIMAKSTSVRLLTLNDKFFLEYGDKGQIDGLAEAIRFADKTFNEYGIPTCDFKIYRNQRKQEGKLSREQILTTAKRGWRRFKMLIKMNKYSYNTFELLIHNAMNKAAEYEENKKKEKEKQELQEQQKKEKKQKKLEKMKNHKTLTVEAKAELAKRQLERTSSMRQSQQSGKPSLLPNSQNKTKSDQTSSKSDASVSSSPTSSNNNSDKGSDDAPQGQKEFTLLQNQNYMQNIQLEAINEEDEHSERGKKPSKLALNLNGSINQPQKSQASKSIASHQRSSRLVSNTIRQNDSINNNEVDNYQMNHDDEAIEIVHPRSLQNQRVKSVGIEDNSGIQNMESSKKGQSSQDYSQSQMLKKLYGDDLTNQGIVSPQDEHNIGSEISPREDNLAQLNDPGRPLQIEAMNDIQDNQLINGPQLSFHTQRGSVIQDKKEESKQDHTNGQLVQNANQNTQSMSNRQIQEQPMQFEPEINQISLQNGEQNDFEEQQDEQDHQVTDMDYEDQQQPKIKQQADPTSIEFVTPHYSMDFKNGDTITDYKMSVKRSSGEHSNRLPVDRFIDQLIQVEDPKKDKNRQNKKDKKDK